MSGMDPFGSSGGPYGSNRRGKSAPGGGVASDFLGQLSHAALDVKSHLGGRGKGWSTIGSCLGAVDVLYGIVMLLWGLIWMRGHVSQFFALFVGASHAPRSRMLLRAVPSRNVCLTIAAACTCFTPLVPCVVLQRCGAHNLRSFRIARPHHPWLSFGNNELSITSISCAAISCMLASRLVWRLLCAFSCTTLVHHLAVHSTFTSCCYHQGSSGTGTAA